MVTSDDSIAKGHEVAGELGAMGVRGILAAMARRGQLIEIRCEMPTCYCPQGRKHFVKKAQPMPAWAPNADHYPQLKMNGGTLTASNVRLSHVLCNREDYSWRKRIHDWLDAGMSLDAIAQRLNDKRVRPPHGSGAWTARKVREAYRS